METLNIPQHVAIILDGNGRWAKKRHLPRNMGHRQGSKVVEQIIEDAHDLGIKYLTVYAFSTENWKRPEDEVNALMKLLRDYLKTCIKRANKNNMKVRVIGDITGLSEDLQEKIIELEKASKDNTGINFTIALNYGSRDEMVRAMRHMADDLENGNLSKEDISEEVFLWISGHERTSRSRLDDQNKWRREIIKLYVMAAGIYRILFYRCVMARL